MLRRWFGKAGGRDKDPSPPRTVGDAFFAADLDTVSGEMELPPPMLGTSVCSDDECQCDEWSEDAQMPPAQGYLYIAPDVVKFRADCRSLDELDHKLKTLQDKLGGAMIVGGKNLFHPIVICEQAAKRRNLDLAAAARDFDQWMSEGRVPCRVTPSTD